MLVDVVMPCFTLPNLYRVTNAAINSMREAEPKIQFNIIIVESNRNATHKYQENEFLKVIPYQGFEFNYNKALCQGLQYGKSDWLIFSNNDVRCRKNFFSTILSAYDFFNGDVKSFACWNEATHKVHFDGREDFYFGYVVPKHISGWFMVLRREVIEQVDFCQPINQRVSFWFSDSVLSNLMEEKGIRHVLLRNSLVDHYQNSTIKNFPSKVQQKLMRGQWQNYLNK